MTQKTDSPQDRQNFALQLKKFIWKKVVIKQYLPNGKLKEYKGVLQSIEPRFMNCIIRTKTKKIAIKHYLTIERDRDLSWKDEK